MPLAKLLKEVAMLPDPILRYNTFFGFIYFSCGVLGVVVPQFMANAMQFGVESEAEQGYVQAFGLAVSRLGITYLSQGLLARSALFVATSIIHRLCLFIPIILTTAIYGWLSWPPVVILILLDVLGIVGLFGYHIFSKNSSLGRVSPESLVPLFNDRPSNLVFVCSGLLNCVGGFVMGFQLLGANAELITSLPTAECTNVIRSLVALTCGMNLVVGYHDLILSASHADSRTKFVPVSIGCRLLLNPAFLWVALAGGVTYQFAAVKVVPEVLFGSLQLAFWVSPQPDGPRTKSD